MRLVHRRGVELHPARVEMEEIRARLALCVVRAHALRAGERRDRGAARRVHDLLRRDVLDPLVSRERNLPAVGSPLDAAGGGIEPQFDAGLLQRLGRKRGVDEGIHLHAVVPPVARVELREIRQFLAGEFDGIRDQVPARPGDDLAVPGVEEADRQHFGGHSGAAEPRIALDQHRLRAGPRGRQRRADAGRPSADHGDVEGRRA